MNKMSMKKIVAGKYNNGLPPKASNATVRTDISMEM